MEQELEYKGYSANPSDYDAADGQLALSMQAINERGCLRTLFPPKIVREGGDGRQLRHSHSTYAYDNYIFVRQSSADDERTDLIDGMFDIVWESKDGEREGVVDKFLTEEIQGFETMGNILIAFLSDSIRYYYFELSEDSDGNVSGAYRYLGDKIPDVNISFGLRGELARYLNVDSEAELIDFSRPTTGSDGEWSNQDEIDDATNLIMGKVNKFIKEHADDDGYFCMPFFVRYALRLYDGSLVGHSVPILMLPNTGQAVIPFSQTTTGEGGVTTSMKLDMLMIRASLDYQLLDNPDILTKWKDIIQSVDVFVSKPIYTHNQDGKITKLESGTSLWHNKFYGKLNSMTLPSFINEDTSESGGESVFNGYAEWSFNYLWHFIKSNPNDEEELGRGYPRYIIPLPGLEGSHILSNKPAREGDRNENMSRVYNDVKDCSTFYHVASIKLESFANSYNSAQPLPIGKDVLSTLVNREVMTDESLTHDKFSASVHFAYNKRLNIANIKRTLFEGFSADSLVPRCDCTLNIQSVEDDSGNVSSYTVYLTRSQSKVNVTFEVEHNGKTYTFTKSGLSNMVPFKGLASVNAALGPYLDRGYIIFFSSTEAKRFINWTIEDLLPTPFASHEMEEHDFLNCSYALLHYTKNAISEQEPDSSLSGTPTETTEHITYGVTNQIYTSEVNNPFLFPISGVNDVGDGTIVGISSAAKALSQGQFGQFPLYAFTTEGVWALELLSTGLYSAVQPLSRDVCISGDSITQLDSYVLFATSRGIMEVSGSNVTCLTDAIKSEELFTLPKLPKADALVEIANNLATEDSLQLTTDGCTLIPFQDFLSSCRMIYDYPNQHVIVYNPNNDYAYVYSLLSGMWGMMKSNISYGVNSYPEALAVDKSGGLLDFSQVDTSNVVPSIVITRPFALDTPDAFKTITDIVQRGNFARGHVRQVLYGSNDFTNWHTVWSSVDQYLRGFRGTPYKVYRLALINNLALGETLHGCSVVFDQRLRGQIR